MDATFAMDSSPPSQRKSIVKQDGYPSSGLLPQLVSLLSASLCLLLAYHCSLSLSLCCSLSVSHIRIFSLFFSPFLTFCFLLSLSCLCGAHVAECMHAEAATDGSVTLAQLVGYEQQEVLHGARDLVDLANVLEQQVRPPSTLCCCMTSSPDRGESRKLKRSLSLQCRGLTMHIAPCPLLMLTLGWSHLKAALCPLTSRLRHLTW